MTLNSSKTVFYFLLPKIIWVMFLTFLFPSPVIGIGQWELKEKIQQICAKRKDTKEQIYIHLGDKEGDTPLHKAIDQHCTETIQTLFTS